MYYRFVIALQPDIDVKPCNIQIDIVRDVYQTADEEKSLIELLGPPFANAARELIKMGLK